MGELATFQRVLPLAGAHALRVICINRRGYPDTTPCSPEEERILTKGSDEERADWLNREGVRFALFLDGLIKRHDLPEKGGIAVVGWSLGNLIAMAFAASVMHIPPVLKEKLRVYLRTVIMYGP